MSIEVLLGPEPDFNKDIAAGIEKGLELYFSEHKTQYTVSRLENAFKEYPVLEDGRMVMGKTLQAMCREKMFSTGRWDFLLTTLPLLYTEENKVLSAGISDYKWRDALVIGCIISDLLIKTEDPELATARGSIITYHELAHIGRDDPHCTDGRCIYGSARSFDDFDALAWYLIENKTVPKCEIHQVA
jgi:hypothetical protein